MTLPDGLWVTEVSNSFPNATFRLLAGVPQGDRALELGEILTDTPQPVVDAMRNHPDISTIERLHLDDQRALSRYEVTDQQLYTFLGSSSLPPEFPLSVENGRMEFDLTATQAQFDAFGEALDATGVQYELLTVVHTSEDGTALLTDRQRECLTVALRRGYFEIPRDCTLAEVAEALDIDKSTASETIRRGQARVLKQYLLSGD
jgi:predicted DNA binding protein